jgi:hypothetical protein
VDITGVQTVETVFLREGSRVRAMVLVALPIGSANVLKSQKEAQQRAPEAFKELDSLTEGARPQSSTKPGESVSIVRPNGSTENIGLVQVENEEYKRRRAEALQKPGAVVGQYTVR